MNCVPRQIDVHAKGMTLQSYKAEIIWTLKVNGVTSLMAAYLQN
jgi:hypothetical protein